MLSILAGVAVLAAVLAGPAPAAAGDLSPAIPKASGSCVEDSQVMRRNHMDFLKHQRDETLRNGIRGAKHSLKDCVSCHVQKGADGKALPVNAEGQFCQSCHSYAAVSVDCFQCHATTPSGAAKTAQR
ncbi:MAG: cytochrome c3 family protein [Solirubrobacterales bacterium]